MARGLAFVHALAVAAFAGGCLLLSVMLNALFDLGPEYGAQVMQTLLPRMGSVMAPLLAVASLSSLGLLALRNHVALDRSSLTRGIMALALVATVLVTVVVHLPLNAELLEPAGPHVRDANALLKRWLNWHHVRTALSLVALAILLEPMLEPKTQPRAVQA